MMEEGDFYYCISIGGVQRRGFFSARTLKLQKDFSTGATFTLNTSKPL